MNTIVPAEKNTEGCEYRKIYLNGVCHQVKTDTEVECPKLVVSTAINCDKQYDKIRGFKMKDNKFIYE